MKTLLTILLLLTHSLLWGQDTLHKNEIEDSIWIKNVFNDLKLNNENLNFIEGKTFYSIDNLIKISQIKYSVDHRNEVYKSQIQYQKNAKLVTLNLSDLIPREDSTLFDIEEITGIFKFDGIKPLYLIQFTKHVFDYSDRETIEVKGIYLVRFEKGELKPIDFDFTDLADLNLYDYYNHFYDLFWHRPEFVVFENAVKIIDEECNLKSYLTIDSLNNSFTSLSISRNNFGEFILLEFTYRDSLLYLTKHENDFCPPLVSYNDTIRDKLTLGKHTIEIENVYSYEIVGAGVMRLLKTTYYIDNKYRIYSYDYMIDEGDTLKIECEIKNEKHMILSVPSRSKKNTPGRCGACEYGKKEFYWLDQTQMTKILTEYWGDDYGSNRYSYFNGTEWIDGQWYFNNPKNDYETADFLEYGGEVFWKNHNLYVIRIKSETHYRDFEYHVKVADNKPYVELIVRELQPHQN